MSSFRSSARARLLVQCGAKLPIPFPIPPNEQDALDRGITSIAMSVLTGTQFDSFFGLYYSTPHDEGKRSSEARIKNTKRAMARLLDYLARNEKARETILKGWQDAQEKPQRSVG
jgi:hypothetical protein